MYQHVASCPGSLCVVEGWKRASLVFTVCAGAQKASILECPSWSYDVTVAVYVVVLHLSVFLLLYSSSLMLHWKARDARYHPQISLIKWRASGVMVPSSGLLCQETVWWYGVCCLWKPSELPVWSSAPQEPYFLLCAHADTHPWPLAPPLHGMQVIVWCIQSHVQRVDIRLSFSLLPI